MLIDRRAVLAGAAAAPFAAKSLRAETLRAGTPPRVAALTWTAAQSLAAIGLAPACAPELDLYARLVIEPALPPETLEIGLRPEPNLERLLSIKPDVILIDDELAPVRARLERIAPVESFDAFTPGSPDHVAQGYAALRRLGERLNLQAGCEAFIARAEETFATARQKLAGYDGRPLLIVSVVDARRALVFGKNSLFQNVLDRLGMKNAWDEPTSPWGHAVVTLDRLGVAPDARFLSVANERIASEAMLVGHPVVGSLPPIRAGRITTLPAILFYGGAPAAARFARLLGDNLPAGSAG